MIVVAYNPSFPKDVYLEGAKKARYKIEAPTVGKLAENIGAYGDHSIATLIIADHGMGGVQGVGSGATRDVAVGKNLSHEHIAVASVKVGGDPAAGDVGTGPEPMMGYLMKLAKSGFSSRYQAEYLDVVARKIKVGGTLLLAGCSVASGDEGASLLKSLGLAVQNSIKVIGSLHETSWTDSTKPVMYPARYSPHRKLYSGDCIGFMGMRPLSSEELDSALDQTDILATGM